MIPLPSAEVAADRRTCTSKWSDTKSGSRRLITYRRLPNSQVNPEVADSRQKKQLSGKSADELNPFRKMYFTKTESR